MAGLKFKVTGYKRASSNSNWEMHNVDGSLHPIFSGVVDGFTITNYKINSIDPSVVFRKDDVDMVAGEEFTIAEMNLGRIRVEYLHYLAGSGTVNLSLSGQAKYIINYTIVSIV